jgi:hypothetical protein
LAFGDAGAVERQTEFDDETAVGAILGSYGSAMETDGAVGDGKAEAGATGGAVARITDAIKGQEDIAEGILGDALAVIADADYGIAAVWAGSIFDSHLYSGSFGSVADGIANDVFDGTGEKLAVAGSAAGIHAQQAYVALEALGFEVCVGDDVADKGAQIEGFVPDILAAALEAGETEQASDEAVEATGLQLDAVEAADGFGIGAKASEAEGDREACEGRAQFVRDVCDETALRGDERFDLFGHVIELATEVGKLVTAVCGAAADASGEIACGQAVGSGADMADGSGDVASEPEADKSSDEKDDGGANELGFQRSAQSVGSGFDGGTHYQDVAAAGGADSSAGDRFCAMDYEDFSVVSLQGALGEGFGFARGRLREDFLTFVVEEIGLGVQSGIERGEEVGESAHAMVVEDIGSAGGDERSDGAVGLRGAAGGEFVLGGDDRKNQGAADQHHGEPEPEKDFQEQSAQWLFTYLIRVPR